MLYGPRQVARVACNQVVCTDPNASRNCLKASAGKRVWIARIADQDLRLVRSVQLKQGLIRINREILMECSDSGAKDGRFIDLERERHSRIEIVVVRQMRLNLISDARRNQQPLGNGDIRLGERAEFELADLDQRVTGILCILCRYSGYVIVNR